MLKAAIEKIESMVHPEKIEYGGSLFLAGADGQYVQVRPELDLPETMRLQSLDALATMVREEALPRYGRVYLHVPDHLTAEAFLPSGPDRREVVSVLYRACATDVPGWDPETKLQFERAAVALQTRFQDSQDRAYTLQLLSQITTGAKITYNDIGVATTIVTQKGVSLQQNATIRPLVHLRPYRTFQELEQPDGLFLIRIDERGITFAEADGGMWKLSARKSIKAYLETALADDIEAGRAVVML